MLRYTINVDGFIGLVMVWSVYIIEASDESLYTGISTDVERRFGEHLKIHMQGVGVGAKYFRGRRPVRVVYIEAADSRSNASVRESALKKLSRVEKLALISSASIPGDR